MRKTQAQSFSQEQKTLLAKWNDYKGKIVAVVGKKVFSADTGQKAEKLLERLVFLSL